MEQSKRHSRGRRWFRISLRRLLVVVALCGVGTAWLSKRYVQPTLAHDQVIALGGGLMTTEEFGVYEVNLAQSNITDSDLRVLGRLTGVTKLWLNDTPITDDCVRFLACLPDLQFVDLRGTQVSASAVRSLQTSLRKCLIVTDSTHAAVQLQYPKGISCPRPNCRTLFFDGRSVCPTCGADCS